MSKPRVNYHEWIKSPEWFDQHPKWIKKANHHCSFLWWKPVGQYKGRYHNYNIHHTHYKNVGYEKFWWDVVPLSSFAHNHIVHGILSGYKTPSQQRDSGGSYPNLPQSLFHTLCRINLLGRTSVGRLILSVLIGLVCGVGLRLVGVILPIGS